MTHPPNPPAKNQAEDSSPVRLTCLCGVLLGNDETSPVDKEGCLLAVDHDGPHEFRDPRGLRWQWETDLSCDCEKCLRGDGDYCTEYWPAMGT